MSVFGAYAQYYDLLYRDKDYGSEARFVSGLIRKHAPNARRVIELGSGTGIHASLLAQDGFSVHGVDRSETMIERARGRLTTLEPAIASRLAFSAGDVRSVRVGQTFDVAISLFHVVSYQVTNDDLLAMFETAATHLERGGLFLFDFWFTSAVLSERPAVRIKRFESDEIEVTRLAEPGLNTRDAYVDVNYHVFIRDKKTRTTDELKESHRMRYLSLGEIDLLGRATGFEMLESGEWMTGREPGADTWGVCSVLRKT